MNWYKQSQQNNIHFLSYNSFGDLKINVDGQTYTYYKVSPSIKDKIKNMINRKVPKGIIFNQLRPFSDPQRYNKLNSPELTPRGYTRQEEEEMIKEFEDQGFFDK